MSAGRSGCGDETRRPRADRRGVGRSVPTGGNDYERGTGPVRFRVEGAALRSAVWARRRTCVGGVHAGRGRGRGMNPEYSKEYDRWYKRIAERSGGLTVYPGNWSSALESAIRRRARRDGLGVSVRAACADLIVTLFPKGERGPGRKAYIARIGGKP